MITISSNTTLKIDDQNSKAIRRAIDSIQKDYAGIFGSELRISKKSENNQILITMLPEGKAESFSIQTEADTSRLIIRGADELGVIFGLYHFAEHFLAVDPFKFWTGKDYIQRESIEIPVQRYDSKPHPLRFRGWFINDEDCLTAWNNDINISDELWGNIFETMLRAGYNTVIPGTGTSPEDRQLDIADSYGLWIAQHHAEPLGAKMLKDVYPDVKARLPEEKNKFEELYKDAVQAAGHRKMIWTLGFRGQGDRPFYEDDPRYDTPEKQSALIKEMMELQMKIVNELREGPHHFIHYIYSESGELYRSGHLTLPDNVIQVFSDNGFGAMRIRRDLFQNDKGITALPLSRDNKKATGIYYHVSFHDLKCSNKLVPLVHPEILKKELSPFAGAPQFNFFICNVSNIRPHIAHLEWLRVLWIGDSAKNFKIRLDERIREWVFLHFPSSPDSVQRLLYSYYDAPFSYDDRFDDCKAGEQLYHHGLRRMIQGIMTKEDVMHWFAYVPYDFESETACFRWLKDRVEESLTAWEKLADESADLTHKLPAEEKRFFQENLGMHISYMLHSCRGFLWGAKAILAYNDGDYRNSFTLFYKSWEAMRTADSVLRSGDSEKWEHFHRGDWLTGTRTTIRYIEAAMSFVRISGEDIIVNSPWMIEALNLKDTAISILPQSSASDIQLARALSQREQSGSSEDTDLSILRDSDA